MEFIALTIRACSAIRYEAVEQAITAGGDAAFVRVQFDWTGGGNVALNVRGDLPLSRRPDRSPGAVLRPERHTRATGARLTQSQSR